MTFLFNVGRITAIVPELIIRYRANQKSFLSNKSNNGLEQVNYKNSKFRKKLGFLIFSYLFLSITDTVNTMSFIFYFSFRVTYHNAFFISGCLENIQVIVTCFACVLFLKTKFELHKKVGIVLIILSMIISLLTSSNSDETNSFIVKGLMIFTCFTNICTPLQECFEKYLMEKKFQSMFMIIFYEGLIGSILPLSILFFFKESIPEQFKLEQFDWKNTIIMVLSTLPYSYIRFGLNWKYNPLIRLVGDKFYSVINTIILMVRNGETEFIVVRIIAMSIMVIGVLIHNEMLILRFCNMDTDTKNEIDIRQITEGEGLIDEYDLISSERIFNVQSSTL
jgi:hypothetical protein